MIVAPLALLRAIEWLVAVNAWLAAHPLSLYHLDQIAAWLSIINATIVCATMAALGPSKKHWFNAPLIGRLLGVPVVLFFAQRGADLWAIAGNTSIIEGHASLATIKAGGALGLYFTGGLVLVLRHTYSPDFVRRIQAIIDRASCAKRSDPLAAPANITLRETLQVLANGEDGRLPAVVHARVVDGWTDGADAPHHPDAKVRVRA